nr:putative transcriptional regulatory protein [Quercus suber]
MIGTDSRKPQSASQYSVTPHNTPRLQVVWTITGRVVPTTVFTGTIDTHRARNPSPREKRHEAVAHESDTPYRAIFPFCGSRYLGESSALHGARLGLILKCSPSRGPPKLIDLAENSTTFEIGMPHHFACQSCRERKLRCDGHRPCCERCEDGNIKCEYIASNTRRSRRSRPPDAGDTTETVKRLCSPEKELSTVSSAASVSLYHLQSHGGAANDLPWLQSVDPGQPSSPDANGFMFLAGPEATDLADMDDWLQSTSRLLDNDRDQRLLSYHNDWSLESNHIPRSHVRVNADEAEQKTT